MKRICWLVWLVLWGVAAGAQNLSPNDYGLREATSDTDRYWALYNTHAAAVAAGVDVDYGGIGELSIELPPHAKTIPLTKHTDFQGLRLHVLNNTSKIYLFTRNVPTRPITLEKEQVDAGCFDSVPELSHGRWMLILQDQTPWTEREGFGYRVFRSDLLLVEEGRAENRPVFPYNTPSTTMQCTYCAADTDSTTFANLTFIRDKRSTVITHLAVFYNINNLLLQHLAVSTPKSKLVGDAVVSLNNCSHVTVRDFDIQGTYSKGGTGSGWGYGIMASNLYRSLFDRISGEAEWGVFGTNNLSDTRLENCSINRFDIHCYGRDVYCKNCYFHTKQTQFSSLAGSVVFDSCHFHDCDPVRIRSSYNAYTPFDVVMRDCRFDATLQHHVLVRVMLLDSVRNSRPELREKCLPNVHIENLTAEVPLAVGHVDVMAPGENTKVCDQVEFDYLDSIAVKGLRMKHGKRNSRATMRFFARPMRLRKVCETTLELITD